MQTLMMSSLRDSNGARGKGGEVLTTDQNQSFRSLQDAVKGSRCEKSLSPEVPPPMSSLLCYIPGCLRDGSFSPCAMM